MGIKFYRATFTTYEDDYKHRYDDGIYPKHKFFLTRKKALEWIKEQYIDYFLDSDISCYKEFEHIEENDEFKKYFEKIWKNKTKLKKILEGEYVDYRASHEIVNEKLK